MNPLFAMALLALPQGDPPGFDTAAAGVPCAVVRIAGAARTAVAVAVPLGYQHDPEGAAGLDAVAAAYLAMRAQRQLPPGNLVRVEVLDDCTLFSFAGQVADTAALRRAVGVLLGGADGDADADALALARARQALAADDAEHVYPGLVLQSRALRALQRGTAAGHWLRGEPRQVQALDDLQVRRRAARFVGGAVWVAVVGDLDAAAWQAAGSWPPPPEPAAPVEPVVRTLPADGPWAQPLPGIGGPFVACAVPAPPPGPDTLAFALAIAVLQQRSALAFAQRRGHELQAQAPPCSYDWLRGDRVVVLTRRGADAAAVAAPRAELEQLLQQQATQPIAAAELQLAAQRLAAELALPPYPPALQQALQRAPEALLPRARVLALSGRRQWPLDLPQQLAQVPLAAVQQAISTALDPDQRWWGAVERQVEGDHR